MGYLKYEQLVGETFFEANLKAETKFGKGNFEVLSSKRVRHSIYFGFGHKELVELTIGIMNQQAATQRDTSKIPARPLPSVEISAPQTVPPAVTRQENSTGMAFPMPARPSINQNKPLQAAPDKPVAKIVDKSNIDAYMAVQKAPYMREVHGLRSNQEGNEEPHPQKLADEVGLEPDQIQDVLSQMLAERKRIKKMTDTPAPCSKQQEALPAPSVAASKIIQEGMNQILAMLKNLNEQSGQALGRVVPDMPEGLYEVKKSLLAIETPVEVADRLVFDLKDDLPMSSLRYPDETVRATSSWLEQKLKFSAEIGSRQVNGPNIVVLIGPTGVGKTTTIAKLAASYGLNIKNRKSIALFTLDTFRIGASEQLQHYAQIIDIDMEVLYKPEDVDHALARHQDKDLIIVDTAGRSQKDTDELFELRSFIERLPSALKYLVLSATSKYTDMLETVHCFGKVGFDHLIFTKVDETNTVGPLLAILFTTGKSLAYITNGQKVPEDFREADFKFFNTRIFPSHA